MRALHALALAASLLLAACGAVMSDSRFGESDNAAAGLIARANRLAALRTAGQYSALAQALESDLQRHASDPFAGSRLRNELADLYSHQVLDIERAIQLDEVLIHADIAAQDTQQTLLPRVEVANQRILADRRYVDDYIRVAADTVRERARQRLRVNRALLQGQPPAAERRYDAAFLGRHLATVQADLPSTHAGSPERRTVLSRQVRAELELLRLQPGTRLAAHEAFLRGELAPGTVDLAEIDYLSLADYLLQAAQASGRVELAEMALEVVYRPYSRIQDSGARWRYNRIVNDTIAALADANYKAGRHEDMLYYLSLNKSRLLLEERLALSSRGRRTDSLASAAAADGMPRTEAGLPRKDWFRQQLAATPALLDFYLASRAEAASATAAAAPPANTASGLLLTRDFGLEDSPQAGTNYVDSALYVTRVEGGRVVSVQRLARGELDTLHRQADALYEDLSRPGRPAAPTLPRFFADLRAQAKGAGPIVVSTDKWLAKLPFDVLLGRPTTRVVNAFMVAEPRALGALNVAGFFNPTGDLPGAEREADAITRVLPTARTLRREAATAAALDTARDANVVHLSMHGSFDARDPRRSKLFFAGAGKACAGCPDPAALHAQDMAGNPALQGKDLVFAAACQTGLSGSLAANDAELLGILRPLTAAGNRSVILSLWNVDDAATQSFVAAFYAHLARSRQVAAAFHAAQAELRSRHPEPYYWAAFYLAQSR